MPRKTREDEIVEILSRFKQLTKVESYGIMEACDLIGQERGVQGNTIYRLVRRFQPTTDAARDYLAASALRLTMRAVRKANVDQAIQILSRPNIGVLEPAKQESSGSQGFFLSVQAENLGAVKVGVMMQGASGSLPSGASSAPSGRDEMPEIQASPMTQPGVPHPNQGKLLGKTLSDRAKKAIEANRKRIQEAQKKNRAIAVREMLANVE